MGLGTEEIWMDYIGTNVFQEGASSPVATASLIFITKK